MVTPDNKITPNISRDSSINSTDDEKRKPPTGDFRKVAEEVDQNSKGKEEFSFDKKDKKKAGVEKMTSYASEDGEAPLLSPFDLARAKNQRDSSDERGSETLEDSLTLFTDKKKKTATPYQPQEPVAANIPPPISTSHIESHLATKSTLKKNIEEEKLSPYGVVGQPDLTTAAPYKPVIAIENLEPTVQAPIKTSSTLPISLQEVVDQIAEKVVSIKTGGENQTVIDLKGNFNGSRVIITESANAQGQLNITIDNLTAANQALVEAHRAQLTNELLQSGVHVRQFIASATTETTRVELATGGEEEQQGFTRDGRDNNPRDGRRQQFDDETT